MIIYKTPEEIAMIEKSGRILSKALQTVMEYAKAGADIGDLDALAEKTIRSLGGVPAFKGYQSHPDDPPFPSSLCASVNEEVVHAPALKGRILREGDIVGLDLGVNYQGFFSDMAVTIPIGNVSDDAKRLLEVTRNALYRGIEQVKIGNHIHDISFAVQQFVEAAGFSVVRDLVGHGVGKSVHEEPKIPNFVSRQFPKVEISAGMVLAIEPMVNAGGAGVSVLEDGWTVATKDKRLSAHFEHTVAVTSEGCKILTEFEGIEKGGK
ncbi:MAG: type I methionyl aminopeptidase [Parcubacteria group bacterium]|nr:type I methionyl aminopeptidase [Parcubacteria group bacterium]